MLKFTAINGIIVSTVKHTESWMGRGYETGIFWPSGKQQIRTYKTKEDALKGHERIASMIYSGKLN